ncbi:MAG: hypothetical protein V1944_02155 [Candidatus Aenigmatarchaeota archaeon]
MEKFDLGLVLRQLPKAVTYLIIGFILGATVGYFLFSISRASYEVILSSWFKRVMFGAKLLNNQYVLWFIINNFVALILAIAGGVLIITNIGRKRAGYSKRFQVFEKHHPKVTMFSLYMLPIGALLINSFLIAFFLMYVYLSRGYDQLIQSLSVLSLNGITEMLALVLAASLGLSYVKVLEPFIMKRKWKESIGLGKKVVWSKTSFYVFVLIAILIVFSAYAEGIGVLLLKK